jgi:hypothetical protein
MDPVKVKAVADWPTPRNLRELHRFLGFANFYRQFIKDFAKSAQPAPRTTSLRRTPRGLGGSANNWPSKCSKSPSRESQSSWCGNQIDPHAWKWTHRDTQWVGFSYKNWRTTFGIQSPFDLSQWSKQNRTTRSMIKRCLPSSVLSKTGATTSKAFSNPLTSSPTTETWSTGAQHRTSLDGKRGGLYTSATLTSISLINRALLTLKQTPFHAFRPT